MTAPTSLIGEDNDNEEMMPLALRSRNPFLASIIAHQQIPSTRGGPDYEWNELVQIDREILGPEQVEAWEIRRADMEARTSWQHRGSQEDMDYFLAMSRGAPFHFGQPTDGELMARVHANQNRELYRTHPSRRRPDLWARTEEEHRLLRE